MSVYHHILNPVILDDLARNWIREELPHFDLQAMAVGDIDIAAKVFCKSPGVLAGIPFANSVFNQLNCSPNWFCKEGEWLEAKPVCEVAYVGGKAHNVLLAERIILNVLSRCSGVATAARLTSTNLYKLGWQGRIAGTRKTTPGFRMVEKYGLLIGGACTHRYDLSDMIMLKDNHITICGSVQTAINKVRPSSGFAHKIEVECRNLEEAQEAALAGADIIMLDNFDVGVSLMRLMSEIF